MRSIIGQTYVIQMFAIDYHSTFLRGNSCVLRLRLILKLGMSRGHPLPIGAIVSCLACEPF